MTRGSDPWSRPIAVGRLPRAGQRIRIVADEGMRARLAALLDSPRVDSFEADVEVRPRSGGRYTVTGLVKARVVRTCVATLEEFAVDVDAPVDAVFADPDKLPEPTAREVERTLDEEDPPEPVEDGVIDAGALAVEFLALSLDPFPRKPGAAFKNADEEPAPPGPFAVLAALKGRG